MSRPVWPFGILVLLIMGISCSPTGPTVAVETLNSSLQPTDTALTSIAVKNITDLTAFEAHLSFDANILEVLELKHGDFIPADFVVQNTFDNAAGTIDYAVAQIDRPPANGSGTLLTIVFRARGQGSSPIQFRATQAVPEGALFSNSDGIAIPVSLIDGSIAIGE